MDYEKRFCQIRDFLKDHQYLHRLEMMNRYPENLELPYHQWVKDIENFDYKSLLALERDYDTSHIFDEGLINFIDQCKSLSNIPYVQTEEIKLQSNLKRKLTPKKVHEIQRIKSYIANFKSDHKTIIDIGSGAGHLSCALVYDQNKHAYCIDMNERFQKQGQKKIDYWLPELKDKMTFVCQKINKNLFYPAQLDQDSSLVIGLHSCGALSSQIIQSLPRHLINFGCCYHKLTDEYNLSQIAKQNPISFTGHALTLAAKCLGTQSIQDIENKFLVKHFRYPVHFFCIDHLHAAPESLGNAKPVDYQGTFLNYLEKYCPQFKNFKISLKEKETNYYFKAGSLRALLGRLIELYIVLDRVIFLQENGLDAKVYQFFTPSISPRNLGIVI